MQFIIQDDCFDERFRLEHLLPANAASEVNTLACIQMQWLHAGKNK